MYALTHFHDEEQSHLGVHLIAVSEDKLALQAKATELETESIREELEQVTFDQLAPVAELEWADWGTEAAPEEVAIVPWGRYSIEPVDVIAEEATA